MGFSTFINNNYCIVYRSHFLIRILHVVYWSGWICKSIVFSLSVKVTLLCVNSSWIIIFSFCSGIGTQGQVSDDRWVVRYGITYSANGLKWTNYTEDNRQKVSSNYFSSACLFMCWSKILCNFVDWYKWSCSRIASTAIAILGNGKFWANFVKPKYPPSLLCPEDVDVTDLLRTFEFSPYFKSFCVPLSWKAGLS